MTKFQILVLQGIACILWELRQSQRISDVRVTSTDWLKASFEEINNPTKEGALKK